jgi:hypothetical protein
MSQPKSIAASSLLLWTVSLMAASALGAADRKNDQANWDNLKTLSQGQEVKVVMNDMKAYSGVFQGANDDGIRVALRTGSTTFARQDILRVSHKTGNHRLRNAGIGAAIGGGAGAGLGAAKGDSSGDFGTAFVAVGGLILGSAIGAGVGALVPSQAWRDVYRAR